MRVVPAAVLIVALSGAAAASAAPPPPVRVSEHSFPGAVAHPPTARSAALALADRWLAGGPWDNPAEAGAPEVVLGGALLRTSRQDLRRLNRRFSDQSFFLDASGGAIGWGAGAFGASLYAAQPLLRVEDNAYTRGTDPSAPPATVLNTTSAREVRAGLAVAAGGSAWRVGAAAEWTRRDDRYETEERSGGPTAGRTVADFSGNGVGAVAGARAGFGGDGSGRRVRIGAAVRWIPAIEVEGEQTSDLVGGASTTTVFAKRGAAVEGGASVEVSVTPAFRALGTLGGHGEQSWDGFDVTRGPGSEWSLGGEYHDARDPWIARFGFGLEEERGVPEPRARRIAIGAAWLLESTRLEVGVLHRSVERPGQPDSSDDRVVFTLVQKL